MNKTALAAIAAATALWASQTMAAVEKIASKIEQVTLYRHLAKVERTGEIELKKGVNELVFEQLPISLEESSLQFAAEGRSELTVLSLDSEVRLAKSHAAGALRRLQQQIRDQQQQIEQLQDQLAVMENQFQLLQLLQQGSLNAEKNPSIEEFSRLQQFSRRTYADLAEEKRKISTVLQQEQQTLERLQQTYQRLGGEQGLMQRIVRVQVQAANDGKQTVKLAYHTGNASWQPQYQLNYNSKNNRLSLQYGAQIQQSSNEDWENVKLVLSGATPIRVGEAPQVQPWVIDFYQPKVLNSPTMALRNKSAAAETDLLPVAAAPQSAVIENDVIASSFQIPGAVSIPGDKVKHNLMIAEIEQQATAEYAFYPNYQNTILLTVSGKNTQNYPLLGGSLRSSYDGKIMGAGYLPTLLPGAEFKQLIGEDQTISVQAEPVKRTQENSGLINKSNVVRLETAYTLQNAREQAVDIVVYDRVPQAVNKEITVNVIEPNPKNVTIDDNGRYQQTFTLAPNSKQTVKQIVSVQYPQDQRIEGL
ncbi:hypothetical protein A1D23_11590 [Chelonobacter oris]|uniref:mucoidy inhibitor MuiA family protein n=1 Tax=Chelonobacter oris TaxID=505317 RepID=UPI0024494F98|nr:mucoidy inhibitor MuiA family protein [Chelonobacter oris]MDH3001095.1 hypothetical protein [Chelonobacter oris]